MADQLDLPSPVFEAPPAYEYDQVDSDRKLSNAMQNSLSIADNSEPDQQSQARNGDDEDEGTGPQQSVPRESVVQSNGSYAPVRPLNIRRKPQSRPVAEKEKSAWFNEVQLVAASSSTGQSRRRALPVPGGRQQPPRPLSTAQYIQEESDEGHSPPPPFTAVDNSLDGPAYERYPSNSRARRSASPAVVLRYTGQDVGASPPPSPPVSPVGLNTTGPMHRRRAVSPGYNPSGHSQQAYSSLKAPSTPSSPGFNKNVPAPPRLEFNPSIAYDDTKSVYGHLPADPVKRGDAAALYSSAVAAIMAPQSSKPSTAQKVKRYTPSITSLPDYDYGQGAQTDVERQQQVYGVQAYAGSRMSFMSTNSAPMPPRFSQASQYPQSPQYPPNRYTSPTPNAQQYSQPQPYYRR